MYKIKTDYQNLQDGRELFEGVGAGWGGGKGEGAVGGDVGDGGGDVFVAQVVVPAVDAGAAPLVSAIAGGERFDVGRGGVLLVVHKDASGDVR